MEEGRGKREEKKGKKSEGGRAAGLYVHVPFCLSKCAYCGFYSVTDVSRIGDWAAAVEREAAFYRRAFPRVDALYLGGGTPSLVPVPILGELLEKLHQQFVIDPGSEVTLEANPNDLDPEKLKALRSFGVNRISLGVQSLADRDLKFLGRRHRVEEARKAAAWIREAGFESLSLDLIYGLPGQSTKSWLEILDAAVALRPDHLSCYELTVEPDTPLGRRMQSGEFVLPGEETHRLFFLETSRFLTRRGFVHYEVSNFALGPSRMARHNRKYWEGGRYLGLGPAAHSFDGRRRWWNGRSLGCYLETFSQEGRPAVGEECLSAEQSRLESLLLGFRNQVGVRLGDLSLDRERKRILSALERTGRIVRKNDRVIPTPEGFLLADSLALLFS